METVKQAIKLGALEEVRKLLKHGKYGVNFTDSDGRAPLHYACAHGRLDVVRMLISEFKADVNIRNICGNTPLLVAAVNGREDVTLALILEYSCSINDKGQYGRSILHHACQAGNVSLTQTLILDHGADINGRDDYYNTPLHVAAFTGNDKVVLTLIDKFGCSIKIKGRFGRSVLHSACEGGNVSLVHTLILNHNADINARDGQGNTPLNVAALAGKEEVASTLINEFGCDINFKGRSGRSVLHNACQGGNVNLVCTLILEHKADINARDSQNNTPLNIAAFTGNKEVALTLINRFGCDINVKGRSNRSVLHNACEGGNISLVYTLILDHKADINARDGQNNTPLNVAALTGNKEVVSVLINEFGCDVNIQGHDGKSVLHLACEGNRASLVQHLVQHLNASLLLVDNYGDTPLHYCSHFAAKECAEILLAANAPVFIRNNGGKSPLDLASGQVKSLFDDYVQLNKDKLDVAYNILQMNAERKYCGSQANTKIFVVGNTGAGKSSLVHSLKNESFFNSFRRVTESSVPLHTAGIIPSIHISKHYGRALFYDFAGDPEYYSSHAAILENLASSSKGDNIFLIVVDLREDDTTIMASLHYWLTFICNQKFHKKPFLFLLGSHLDQITKKVAKEKEQLLKEECEHSSQSGLPMKHFVLDCCKPGSAGMTSLQKHLATLAKSFPKHTLSPETSVLLGLLEKDFINVTAFSLNTLVSHIKDTVIVLPKDPSSLYLILKELHELGLLFIVGSSNEDNIQIILNVSKLTNEVHKLLFSMEAGAKLARSGASGFNIGLIPISVLSEILPEYITKDCLIHLQYCHQIESTNLGLFSSISQSTIPNEPFLFFPALCNAEKSFTTWNTPSDQCYGIGWLAECLGQHFPSRFLHVLLLRLVFKFTLPTALNSNQFPQITDFQHRCALWRTGVYWKMLEGVECVVELVNNSRDLVILTRSKKNREENCIYVFNALITCVMETKAEFCHSVTPQFFLLDSTDKADYLSRDNRFAMSEAESALDSPVETILSITGERFMERKKLTCMRKLTLWDSLFPLEFSCILHYLRDIVKSLVHLSDSLGIPHSVWDAIEVAHPRDVERWRRELVRAWMSSSLDPPCWCALVRALKDIDKEVLACSIEEKHRIHIQVQEKLLSGGSTMPDTEFLELFSIVVSGKWQSLASLLSLSSIEIEKIKKEKDLSQQAQAHLMLKKWVSKGGITYSQLYNKLKTISLFHNYIPH